MWELVKVLVFKADKEGLTEFEVHGLVRDAFRKVHEMHLRRLDKWWDDEFHRLQPAIEKLPGSYSRNRRWKT